MKGFLTRLLGREQRQSSPADRYEELGEPSIVEGEWLRRKYVDDFLSPYTNCGLCLKPIRGFREAPHGERPTLDVICGCETRMRFEMNDELAELLEGVHSQQASQEEYQARIAAGKCGAGAAFRLTIPKRNASYLLFDLQEDRLSPLPRQEWEEKTDF